MSRPNLAKRQRYEFRAILRNAAGEFAKRVFYVRLPGLDLYSGIVDDETGAPSFRVSFHQSGQTNLHYRNKRVMVSNASAPVQVDEPFQIQLVSLAAPDVAWGYVRKPETPERGELIIDIDAFPLTWVALYVLGPHQSEEASYLGTASEWFPPAIAHRLVTTTLPNLLVIVGGLTKADVDRMAAQMSGTPMDGTRPTAMVPGSSPTIPRAQ